MENTRPPIGGPTAETTPFQGGGLMEESIGHRSACQIGCDGCSQDSQQSVTDVEYYSGDESSYVYSSEESDSCSNEEEEEWNSSDELDWEGFQEFSAPLSKEYAIETTMGNEHTTNETSDDDDSQEESQRLADGPDSRINTSDVSRECTPSHENGFDDVVFLYAIEKSEIEHVGRQGEILAGTPNHCGNDSVCNDDMPIMSRSDEQNSEQLYHQLELICELSRMGPGIASSDAPIYSSICNAISGMAVAALHAADSEGLLERFESGRSEAKEKVEVRSPARANEEIGGLEVPVGRPTSEDLGDIYSSSG
ncbi:hypothetical protein KHU50_006516 [Colletotrichum sp. SAR 10_65]|nr:hypothetical protein K4K51_007104 [Colletotrichum sp. SAR 10_75]KAI8200770.1 hypothetical protein KHU50_006516 [Colletotrichum sp. SAR 10_65]